MAVISIPGEGGENLKRALAQIDSKIAKVGWIDGSRYPSENGHPGEYVAQAAATNEFGDPSQHIPARPFIRPTIAKEKVNWAAIAEKGGKAIFTGKATVDTVMEAIGQKASGDIKKAISRLLTPALSPKTIAARISRSGLSSKKKENLSTKILNRTPLNPAEHKSLGLLTKPLIDTGLMLNTLTNSVEDA